MPSASPTAPRRRPCSTPIGRIRFPRLSPTSAPIGGVCSRARHSPARSRKRARTGRCSRSAPPTGTDRDRTPPPSRRTTTAPLLQALDDPDVALGAVAERRERALVAVAVVGGDRLLDARELGDDDALLHARLEAGR